MTPYFLILALLLGLAPAIIAHGKGRNFLVWWLYGALLGPVALIHSIMLRGRQQPRTAMLRDSSESQTPWSSPWPLMLRIAASFAIAIVAVAAYRYFVPPASETTADNREIALSADRTPPAQPSESAANGAEKSIEPKSQGDSPAVAKPALPAAGASEATPLPPSPAVSGPAAPSPTVNVTVREDSAATAEDAPKPAAPAKAADTAEPAPQPQEQAAAPPPPPPSPVPPAKQLERTVPLERTVAEKPDPAAKEEQAPVRPVRDVGKLAARTAPVEPAAADPVISATPREDSLQRERPEEPARRKPVTRKAATPKPAPPPPAPAPTDVTAVGETVRVVQQALAERGYDPGPPNGRAGRQTELAIRKFQEDRGLKPSGTIDYAVLESLNIVGPRVHAFQPPPGATLGR